MKVSSRRTIKPASIRTRTREQAIALRSYFANPNDFSALPLSSLSAFMPAFF
jgi:hypothetical protein